MYEYLQALHKRFFQEPRHDKLRQPIEQIRRELVPTLNPSQRRLLLRLLDSQCALKNEISLDSFVAGFKLAAGIAKELETEGLYSYDSEIEERIAQEIHNQ